MTDIKDPIIKPVSVAVSNPSHYAGTDYIEPIDVIRGIQFNLGSAYKYLARLGLKGGDNTVERDSNAAIWYSYDLLHMLLTMEDGEFVPTLLTIHKFDIQGFTDCIKQYAKDTKSVLAKDYGASPAVNATLAAIHMVDHYDKSLAQVGASDEDYRWHIMSAMVVCVLVVKIAQWQQSIVTPGKWGATQICPAAISTIYKGSKAVDVEDDTYDMMEALASILDKMGLHTKLHAFSLGMSTALGEATRHTISNIQ